MCFFLFIGAIVIVVVASLTQVRGFVKSTEELCVLVEQLVILVDFVVICGDKSFHIFIVFLEPTTEETTVMS